MKPLVIFGRGQHAEVVHHLFVHDSPREVVAFSVDADFMQGDEVAGLPVVPFEEIEQRYPPDDFDLFVALGYSGLNQPRADKVAEAKAKGYRLASYLSSRASVWPGFELGENTFIFEDNTLQPFTTVGDDVVLWSGNHVGHHARIGDHCFITSHVVIAGGVSIGEYTFVGINATLRDQISVGSRCIIGAGSLLLGDVEEGGVYRAEATPRSRVPSSRLRGI